MILVLRDTGMRRGELSLMTWDRVDFNEATIFLPNDSVKNARGRTVAIEPDTVRAIHKYRRRLFEWELTNKRYPSDRVWIGRLGEHDLERHRSDVRASLEGRRASTHQPTVTGTATRSGTCETAAARPT